jgi:branched-chain amino acid transport system substrate-binding protein
MMLGGDTWPAVQPVANQTKMLVSTLLPSDLSPDTPYLIAPCEVHPIYNVTGVQWLAENKPDLKKAVIRAVAGREQARPQEGRDLRPGRRAGPAFRGDLPGGLRGRRHRRGRRSAVLRHLDYRLRAGDDLAALVHPLCEQAYQQGFKGQIISCTADFYEQIIEKTSVEFMEGFIFQFPDFDDAALSDPKINFQDSSGFYAEYSKRWPGEWGAVSWEYASILDLWRAGAEKAGSIEPTDVLAGMKAGGTGKHAFGEASWWGKELFGIDNALVGDWPVVVIEGGKAKIKEFKSITAWWDKNSKTMIKHFEAMGEMYYQRG